MWGSNSRWEGGGRPPRRAPSCRGRPPGRGGRPGCHGRRVRGGEGWSRVCAGRQRATEGGRMAVRRHAREGEEDGRALCRSRAEPTSRRCTRRGRCPASSLQFGAGRSEGKEWWRSEGGGRWRRRQLRGRKDGGKGSFAEAASCERETRDAECNVNQRMSCVSASTETAERRPKRGNAGRVQSSPML